MGKILRQSRFSFKICKYCFYQKKKNSTFLKPCQQVFCKSKNICRLEMKFTLKYLPGDFKLGVHYFKTSIELNSALKVIFTPLNQRSFTGRARPTRGDNLNVLLNNWESQKEEEKSLKNKFGKGLHPYPKHKTTTTKKQQKTHKKKTETKQNKAKKPKGSNQKKKTTTKKQPAKRHGWITTKFWALVHQYWILPSINWIDSI